MPKYAINKVIEALRLHHGLLVFAADELGCSRQTLYNYAERYPVVAAVLSEERERRIDLAEQGLDYHLEQKSPWAIALVLRTVGKSRGYADKIVSTDTRELSDTQEWQEVQSALLATLQPYPEARWAVVRALNGNGHESQNGHSPSA